MKIFQQAKRAVQRTTARRWWRSAAILVAVSGLSSAAVSTPAGADGSSTSSSGTSSSAANWVPQQSRTWRTPMWTPTSINGTGSSFASPAIDTWVNAVHGAPYSLSISWSPSNSGTGRYEFTNQTTDFAVSDIGYVGNTDTTPPSFPFNFIPITVGGIAFMYHIPGLTKQLQLSSYGLWAPDRRHQELERSVDRR